jgi:hypothetical protein
VFVPSFASAEEAEDVLQQYLDGSNSWMWFYLGLPAEVASHSRQFLTPPPVFFLEKDDIILGFDEYYQSWAGRGRRSPESWTKTIIMRRAG